MSKEDPIEEIVMDFCGENYGIRETHDPIGQELLTTKQIAKLLSSHFGRIISVDTIRMRRMRHWEELFHYCVKHVNSDYSRQQIYYSMDAIDVFKRLLTEKNEEIFISPNIPNDTRTSKFRSSSDDPIFEIMGKMLDVLKIYVSNKKRPIRTKQLEDKFMDLLEFKGEDNNG